MANQNILFTFVSSSSFDYYMNICGDFNLECSGCIVIGDFEEEHLKTSYDNLSFLAYVNKVLDYSVNQPFPYYTILLSNKFIVIKNGAVIWSNFAKSFLEKTKDARKAVNQKPCFNGLVFEDIVFESDHYEVTLLNKTTKTVSSFILYENKGVYDEPNPRVIITNENGQKEHKPARDKEYIQVKFSIKCPQTLYNCHYIPQSDIKELEKRYQEAVAAGDFDDDDDFEYEDENDTKIEDLPYFINCSQQDIIDIIDCVLCDFHDYYLPIYKQVPNLVLGLSGGLDSALTLLLLCKAIDQRKLPRTTIHALIMPSAETSKESVELAVALASALEVSWKVIDISKLVSETNKVLDNNEKNIMYENSQARIRTSIILNYCNLVKGMMIGTTDFSEFCLGFITFGGDLTSHFQMLRGIPKSLVRLMVKFLALKTPSLSEILNKIINRPISPELIKGQNTEDILGSYIINDSIISVLHQGSKLDEAVKILTEELKISTPEAKKYIENFKNRFLANYFKLNFVAKGPNPLGFSFFKLKKIFKDYDKNKTKN